MKIEISRWHIKEEDGIRILELGALIKTKLF